MCAVERELQAVITRAHEHRWSASVAGLQPNTQRNEHSGGELEALSNMRTLPGRAPVRSVTPPCPGSNVFSMVCADLPFADTMATSCAISSSSAVGTLYRVGMPDGARPPMLAIWYRCRGWTAMGSKPNETRRACSGTPPPPGKTDAPKHQPELSLPTLLTFTRT